MVDNLQNINDNNSFLIIKTLMLIMSTVYLTTLRIMRTKNGTKQ